MSYLDVEVFRQARAALAKHELILPSAAKRRGKELQVGGQRMEAEASNADHGDLDGRPSLRGSIVLGGDGDLTHAERWNRDNPNRQQRFAFGLQLHPLLIRRMLKVKTR